MDLKKKHFIHSFVKCIYCSHVLYLRHEKKRFLSNVFRNEELLSYWAINYYEFYMQFQFHTIHCIDV